MGKNKHRQASTPESKKQAAVWCAIAIIAITVMVLVANPWKQQTSTTSTPQSSQSAQTRSHKPNKKKNFLRFLSKKQKACYKILISLLMSIKTSFMLK